MADNDLRDLFFNSAPDVQQEILVTLFGQSIIHTEVIKLLMSKGLISRTEIEQIADRSAEMTWGMIDQWLERSRLP